MALLVGVETHIASELVIALVIGGASTGFVVLKFSHRGPCLDFIEGCDCIFDLLGDVALGSLRLLLEHDEESNLLIEVRHVAASVTEKQQLVVQLVLVLLLLLLPGRHLTLHYFLVCVNIVLQLAALLLNGVHLAVYLDLNLLHLLLDDAFHILRRKSLLHRGLLARQVVDDLRLALLAAEHCLLQIDFQT